MIDHALHVRNLAVKVKHRQAQSIGAFNVKY